MKGMVLSITVQDQLGSTQPPNTKTILHTCITVV